MKLSFITPIYNRHEYLPDVLKMFREQTYANKELIIVDDSAEPLPEWLVNAVFENEIVYMRLTGDRRTIGEKRNIACEIAKGDIICHMDSDDYYAPDWGERSLHELINSNKQITGLKNAYFQRGSEKWKYTYKAKRPYAMGATFCYFKSLWQKHPFGDQIVGEDMHFLFDNKVQVHNHAYIDGFLATIHENNTCKRTLSDPAWSRVKECTQIHSR